VPAPDDGREPSVGDIARFGSIFLAGFAALFQNHDENTDLAFIAL